MAWDGNGSFSRTNGTHTGATTWANSRDAGNNITASLHDLHDQDLADGIAACLTKNNETKPTATFSPNSDNSYDLGTSALRWRRAYLSGYIGDANGNELVIFSATASAINEFTVVNAALGNPPLLKATGGDTNIALRLVPKGTGDVQFADGTDNTKIVAFECSGITTGTTRTLTVPDASGTLLVSGGAVTTTDSNFTLQDNGDTTKQAKFECSGITTGNTRTYTLPDASTTVVGTDTTQTLTNKSAVDATFSVVDDGDATKILKFQCSGITTGTTRTLTVPNESGTIALVPVADRVQTTSGTITTTSTSLVDLTGATVTMTTGANRVLVGQTCTASHGSADGFVTYNVDIDGTLQFGTAGIQGQAYAGTAQFNMSFQYLTAALSAASHTIKVQWKTNTGTASTLATSATAYTFSAVEQR